MENQVNESPAETEEILEGRSAAGQIRQLALQIHLSTLLSRVCVSLTRYRLQTPSDEDLIYDASETLEAIHSYVSRDGVTIGNDLNAKLEYTTGCLLDLRKEPDRAKLCYLRAAKYSPEYRTLKRVRNCSDDSELIDPELSEYPYISNRLSPPTRRGPAASPLFEALFEETTREPRAPSVFGEDERLSLLPPELTAIPSGMDFADQEARDQTVSHHGIFHTYDTDVSPQERSEQHSRFASWKPNSDTRPDQMESVLLSDTPVPSQLERIPRHRGSVDSRGHRLHRIDTSFRSMPAADMPILPPSPLKTVMSCGQADDEEDSSRLAD